MLKPIVQQPLISTSRFIVVGEIVFIIVVFWSLHFHKFGVQSDDFKHTLIFTCHSGMSPKLGLIFDN